MRRNPWLYGEGLTCCTARASTPELSDKGILELFEKSPQKKLNSSYKPEPRPAERVKVGPDEELYHCMKHPEKSPTNYIPKLDAEK